MGNWIKYLWNIWARPRAKRF